MISLHKNSPCARRVSLLTLQMLVSCFSCFASMLNIQYKHNHRNAQDFFEIQLINISMQKIITSTLRSKFSSAVQWLRRPLFESDPQIYQIVEREKKRQATGINLIASENYCSAACLSATGSILNNKYAEGYPGARYYGGTEEVDKIQIIAQQRALAVMGLDPKEWGVNVQALSGVPANMAVYTGLLNPFDRIMSLDLPHGGHLSHGFQVAGKKISAVSKYFQVFPYQVDLETKLIDYDTFHKNALIYRPKLIVAGASAYSRLLDYKKFREICDDVGAYLLADVAHIAGLISAGVIPSPFPYVDVLTTTTNKSLRATRGSLTYYRVGAKKDKKGDVIVDKKGKQLKYDLKEKIDAAVFPGLQGGPHMHSIAGVAVAMKEALSPEFKECQQSVLKNSKAICDALIKKGLTIVSGGTENHCFSIDMRCRGLDGGRMQAVMDHLSISVNKNTVPGDKSALIPSGIRLGSNAMTTRGCQEKEFQEIANFIDTAIGICQNIAKKCESKKLKDFRQVVLNEVGSAQIVKFNKEVQEFCKSYPTPAGF